MDEIIIEEINKKDFSLIYNRLKDEKFPLV